METTDRYKALGVPYPDPETMCKGQCEGLGVVPIYMPAKNPTSVFPDGETDPVYIKLWKEAEAKEPAADGWHFVECPDCKGTG
jgi:hypothetical protein